MKTSLLGGTAAPYSMIAGELSGECATILASQKCRFKVTSCTVIFKVYKTKTAYLKTPSITCGTSGIFLQMWIGKDSQTVLLSPSLLMFRVKYFSNFGHVLLNQVIFCKLFPLRNYFFRQFFQFMLSSTIVFPATKMKFLKPIFC